MNVTLAPAPDSINSDQALYMAKLAEAAERYDEMTAYMKRCVGDKSGDDLSVEQRNLISVGYKNLMAARRTAWRVLDQNVQVANEQGLNEDAAAGEEYKTKIAAELQTLITEVSDDVVAVFTKGPGKASDPEVLVFFHKMEGDYNRYGAEISNDAAKEAYGAKALAAYTSAQEMATDLAYTNPIRLGLALNFSVFYYEILNEKPKAAELAQTAFDEAIDKLDQLDEEQYRDSTLIMQLLKDNLTLWNETDDEMDVVDLDNQ